VRNNTCEGLKLLREAAWVIDESTRKILIAKAREPPSVELLGIRATLRLIRSADAPRRRPCMMSPPLMAAVHPTWASAGTAGISVDNAAGAARRLRQ
jgi:hypothetical protein